MARRRGEGALAEIHPQPQDGPLQAQNVRAAVAIEVGDRDLHRSLGEDQHRRLERAVSFPVGDRRSTEPPSSEHVGVSGRASKSPVCRRPEAAE